MSISFMHPEMGSALAQMAEIENEKKEQQRSLTETPGIKRV
jgi:hypothetical protein